MKKPHIKSHPPSSNVQEIEEARNNFINGVKKQEKNKKIEYPWEKPNVREDVKKLFSLRLPEPEMLKLQFIQQQTGKSMHQFCLEAILPAIEEKIEQIT